MLYISIQLLANTVLGRLLSFQSFYIFSFSIQTCDRL